MIRPHPTRVVVHEDHLAGCGVRHTPQILVFAEPLDVFESGEELRRDVAGSGKPLQNFAGVRRLDAGEQGYAPEPLVAERQEGEQAGARAGAQGVVDQRALQVQRENFDVHSSEPR